MCEGQRITSSLGRRHEVRSVWRSQGSAVDVTGSPAVWGGVTGSGQSGGHRGQLWVSQDRQQSGEGSRGQGSLEVTGASCGCHRIATSLGRSKRPVHDAGDEMTWKNESLQGQNTAFQHKAVWAAAIKLIMLFRRQFINNTHS